MFTLTGGMTMHLVDSVGRHPLIKVIPMHHEQAAGIAANAYGRIKNTAGFVLVTAGPGALNAVTPCAGACPPNFSELANLPVLKFFQSDGSLPLCRSTNDAKSLLNALAISP